MSSIAVGDEVRSYDFPDLETSKTLYYVQGIVEAIGMFPTEGFNDCRRYKIKVTKRVWNGKSEAFSIHYVFPPVNGLRKTFGGFTSAVEKIPRISDPVSGS